MSWKAELHFIQVVFEKCHLAMRILNPQEPIEKQADVRKYIPYHRTEESYHRIVDLIPEISANTVYRVTDILLCSYLIFILPETTEDSLALIGPYRSGELSEQQLWEFAEQVGAASHEMQKMKQYYEGTPVLEENNPVFTMLDVFWEHMWGGNDRFEVVNVDKEYTEAILPLFSGEIIKNPEDTIWNMQAMERRYACENELMQAVTNGQEHKAERVLSSFPSSGMEKRLTDPVRNMKNYCIIMNTLLRKAAENGGVHPLYLDSVSSGFAKKIENLNSTVKGKTLMKEMTRSYCRLVKKHALHKYSPPVQKAIAYIDSDLTADLSLSALAALQNVSSGYLSALFKQETGQTLTEHVNEKRIKLAMRLLKTTKLQIQTVAQYCGIVDVHYFSRLFKKYVGKTPKEYRKNP